MKPLVLFVVFSLHFQGLAFSAELAEGCPGVLFYTERAEKASTDSQWEEAGNWYKAAIRECPNNVDLYFKHVDMLELMPPYGLLITYAGMTDEEVEHNKKFITKTQEQIASLKKIIELTNKHMMYKKIGDLYLSIDDYQNGIKNYSMALEKSGVQASTLRSRATCYRHIKNYEAALQDLTSAITINPDSKELYVLRGNVLVELGRLESALSDYVKGDAPLLSYIFLSRKNSNMFKKVELHLKGLLARQPKNTEILSSIANVLESAGKYDEAMIYINKAIDINPKDSSFYGIKGDILYGRRDIEGAIRNYTIPCMDDPSFFCREMHKAKQDKYRGDHWKLVFESSDGKSYYDTRKNTRSGDKASIWIRHEAEPTWEQTFDYTHALTLFEIDCKKNKLGEIKTLTYSNNGEVLSSYAPATIYTDDIVPDTLGAAIAGIACGKSKVINKVRKNVR